MSLRAITNLWKVTKSGVYHFQLCSASSNAARVVFDTKLKRLHKDRTAKLEDVAVFEYLKKEAAAMVADRVADVKRSLPLTLDLGCGRGFISEELSQLDGVDMLIQGDTSNAYLLNSCTSVLDTQSVTFGEENLPFRDETFDMVLTSMSLHWVNDLPACFKEVLRVLKSDGCFIGMMLGADSLFELRCSLQLAELEREGGMAPHVSPMIQGHQLANLMYNAGFTLVTLDFDQLVVNYPSMFEVMYDLKGMGENNCAINIKPIHRDTILAASGIYQSMYGDLEKNSVPCTYQMLFMIGWKAHESQPKPLDPGAVPKGLNVKMS
ncbi:arginine-hydroxylase NDUFAF5, mitochondrial [Ciona intestinalis]